MFHSADDDTTHRGDDLKLFVSCLRGYFLLSVALTVAALVHRLVEMLLSQEESELSFMSCVYHEFN